MTKVINPFEIISPEDLTPEQIKDLFVKNYTELNILKNKKHTIIYGSRGNGKSMLLRFLEPRCQILDRGVNVNEYFETPGSFLGIYIPFKEGYFNKADLLTIKKNVAIKLSAHLINIHIISCFIDIVEKQLAEVINDNIITKIASIVFEMLDSKNIHDKKGPLNFERLRDMLRKEINLIDDFISFHNFPNVLTVYKGNLTDYHTFIKPFFKQVSQIIGILKNVSYYLLFDEGDRLFNFQATYINTMMANRDHSLISIKLATKIGGYECYYTTSGTLIQEIHDFDTIFLDELYTHSKDAYYNKVKDIANRRLELSGFNLKVVEFLPESKTEKKLFEKMKSETMNEWKDMPPENRTKDKNGFVNKYAMARLFQYLAKNKIPKRYVGFNNIVHFSSGILRNFLHPCYKMYNSALDDSHDFIKKPYIPETIQDKIIMEYTDTLYNELDDALEGLDPNLPEQKEKYDTIVSLKKLLDGLGEIYYKKLVDRNSRDPRIISVALKDKPTQRLKNVLQYGVKEAFFHKIYTVSKSGGGRYECYILNRALCPRYKLDLSSLRGRIILNSSVLEQIIDSPNDAKKIILKKDIKADKVSQIKAQRNLFDSEIFEEDDDE